jgi:predicted ATPase
LKIESLQINNFRGIRQLEMVDLGHMIIIAGQNGSGKSCVFDGIRLIKSVYGGYQANEWQQWMGEFQIAVSNRSSDFKSIYNDPSREMRIICHFKLADEERTFIQRNASDLLKEMIWRLELPEAYSWGGYRLAMFASQFRDREPAVAARAQGLYSSLISELERVVFRRQHILSSRSSWRTRLWRRG